MVIIKIKTESFRRTGTSLDNETKQSKDRFAAYREYTSGITREQIEKDLQSDTNRLKALYKEALGDVRDPKTGQEIGVLEKFNRIVGALSSRMNPTRRLVFGVALVGFFVSLVGTGLFFTLLLPTSFLAMTALLLVELLEKLDVKREINLAKEIQISLLPSPFIKIDSIELCSFANTAHEVGGDYVDVIDTEKGSYYIIADVSGKGLSAALYMVRLQALVHLLIKNIEPSPKQLFLELNDFIKSYRTDKTFITACVAFFPKDGDHFVYARAGHNPPILYNHETDSTSRLQAPGFALGMTRTQRLKLFLKEVEVPFKKGDSILFYTDGLNEARNSKGEEFGMERAQSLMDIYGSLEAETIVRKYQNSLEQFIGDMPTVDDITFSCVKKMDNPEKPTENAVILEESNTKE